MYIAPSMDNYTISLIVAADKNYGIGLDNKLLCHLPNDLKFFKSVTTGHTIVMGRKTYDSLGKPLPNRKNVILSRNKSFHIDNCPVINSIPELQNYLNDEEDIAVKEIFIIGGESIFKQTIQYASKIYFTQIDHIFEADSFFPEIDNKVWKIDSTVFNQKVDEKHKYSFKTVIYVKKYKNSSTKKPSDISQHLIDF